jgi:alpha-tubulin suppressor-like RCC1 family protein
LSRTRSAGIVVAAIAFGTAGCGESGTVLTPAPKPTAIAVRVDRLAAGPYHTCAIDGGHLHCWGSNAEGELGVGDQQNRSTPTAVAGDDWNEVVIGERHTCASRTGGSVWCWGDGSTGQLGTGQPGPATTPAFVSLPAPVVSLGSTYGHTCAIDEAKALRCWGANAEGQLAQDDPFPGPGADRSTPVRVGTDADWLVVDAGQGHTCGIRSPGDLWCWGRNSSGELGIGTLDPMQIRVPLRVGTDQDWTFVRIGQSTSCGLRGAGALYCWGDNTEGSGGFGDTNERDAPTRVGAFDDWIDISVDTFHSCGIRKDGSLYCWGRNAEGQLGLGDTDDRLAPTRVGDATDWIEIAAGRFHSCGLRRGGEVSCTGMNDDGQLGLGDLARRSTFTPVAVPP